VQCDTQISDLLSRQLTNNVTRYRWIESIARAFMKRMINYQCINETTHVIKDGPNEIEALTIADEKNSFIGPGELGIGLEIERRKLLSDDIQKYDDGLEKNAFNAFASDLISTHRTLPDVRDEGCRKIKYKESLFTASVVICFHNEVWSVLLRSIHSIIDRTPRIY
jgi:hypothetical protein